tara:strand:- start:7608 stop:8654 length:1047 start_codon:yes stop_codon:yes gene_type:complete
MLKIMIIQPICASYRVPLFEAISSDEIVKELIVFSDNSASFGYQGGGEFDQVLAAWRRLWGGLMFPKNIRGYFSALVSSGHCLHFSDFKYLTLWISIFYCRFSGRKCYLHGQGGYKGKQGFVKKIVYSLAVFLSSGYICYSTYSRLNLIKLIPSFLHKKISVVENSLYMDSHNCFHKESKGLFFVGRLREGCGIEIVLEAAKNAGVCVHVVGDGDFLDGLRDRYPDAKFYGAVFNIQEQKRIAAMCMAGVYGGDAGLSVVHYMAWGLPVIVHDSLRYHMGPEPGYVKDGFNGLYFKRGNQSSLEVAIARLIGDFQLSCRLSVGALDTFEKLSNPPMHVKFINIFKGCS